MIPDNIVIDILMNIQTEIRESIDRQTITSVQANKWWKDLNELISILARNEDDPSEAYCNAVDEEE